MKISRFLSVFSVVAVSLMSVISTSGGGRKMIFNDGREFSLTSDSVAPARVDYDDKNGSATVSVFSFGLKSKAVKLKFYD